MSAPLLAQTPELFQKRFESGVLLLGNDPSQAAKIFGSLYQETQSSRVQLELARALYLSNQLDAAQTEFIDVLQKQIPITVRDKVELGISGHRDRSFQIIVTGDFKKA
jgi:hypothetical protein